MLGVGGSGCPRPVLFAVARRHHLRRLAFGRGAMVSVGAAVGGVPQGARDEWVVPFSWVEVA